MVDTNNGRYLCEVISVLEQRVHVFLQVDPSLSHIN